MRGVKVPDAREARLMNYFNQQDDFWAFREWPLWVQEEMVKAKKRNHARYKLFLFFTFNGLNPDTTFRWVSMQDFKGGPIDGPYKPKHWAHFAQLLTLAKKGDLVKYRTPKRWLEHAQRWEGGIFDMILGYVV